MVVDGFEPLTPHPGVRRSTTEPPCPTKTNVENKSQMVKYKENVWLTQWAAVSQTVATKQPKPN